MDEMSITGKICPACGSPDYVFRGRKKINPEPGQEGSIETKYRCKGCGHEWRVRIPTKGPG